MPQFSFLQDEETRAVIAYLAAEAAEVWAPAEVGLADLITEEYLDQVQEADQLLYVAPAAELSLGIGDAELWLLIILPVLTGFVANLMAAFSAWSLHTLRERLAARAATPSAQDEALLPQEVRQLLAAQARPAGLSEAQIEQLVTVVVAGLMSALAAGQQGGGAS